MWYRRSAKPAALLLGALLVGCGGSSSGAGTGDDLTAEQIKTEVVAVAAAEDEPKVKLPKGAPAPGLKVRDIRVGEGLKARRLDRLTTEYVAVYADGRRLESSWDPGWGPFVFTLGSDQANPGWERGLRGMRVGGRRELSVPPRLASRFAAPGGKDPDGTLIYVVDLVGLKRPGLTGRGEPKVEAPKGPPPEKLQVRDLIVGEGAEAESWDLLTVEYVGVNWDGSPFTNSWERRKPFRFRLDAVSPLVNPGWDIGLQGMRVGGRREIVVPPDLLYRGTIPHNSPTAEPILYVIDLVALSENPF